MTRLSPAQAAQLLDAAPVAMVVTDGQGRVTWCNATFTRLLDCPAAEVLGHPLEEVEARLLEDAGPGLRRLPPRGQGPERWLARQAGPHGGGQAVFFTDVSETVALRAERDGLAKRLAGESPLEPVSGLLNRRAMLQGLDPLLSRSRRYQNPLGVIHVELSNHAQLYEALGAAEGDRLMAHLGQVLRDRMRWADLVCRPEPDSFVLILPETGEEATARLCGKLEAALEEALPATEPRPRLRVGGTAWQKGDDAASLLCRAREAAREPAAAH